MVLTAGQNPDGACVVRLDWRLPGQVGLTCEQEVPRPLPTSSFTRLRDVPWLAGPRPMRRAGTLTDVHKGHSTCHVSEANVMKLNSNGDEIGRAHV